MSLAASVESGAFSMKTIREDLLPPKVKELIEELQRAAFVDSGGKGSHRNFVRPHVAELVTVSGLPGNDANLCSVVVLGPKTF
jgi:predicted RNA binding protein YcfA (HicA-like mRNA interferase family)